MGSLFHPAKFIVLKRGGVAVGVGDRNQVVLGVVVGKPVKYPDSISGLIHLYGNVVRT